MDKQSLLKIVTGLNISEESKEILTSYIEDNQNDPNLSEKIATVLDTMAAQSDMAADQLSKIIDSLEDYKMKIQEQSEKYEEETDKIIDKFQNDTLAGVEAAQGKYASQAAPAAPVAPVAPVAQQQNVGFGGQQYNAPQPAPFPGNSGMGQQG